MRPGRAGWPARTCRGWARPSSWSFLPPEEHEPVIAAFRAFAAAPGELPEPGAALGWAGP
ncbi:MAG TPA: hypothetical protein VF162_16190 [Streptosporangiaceae bacterium]